MPDDFSDFTKLRDNDAKHVGHFSFGLLGLLFVLLFLVVIYALGERVHGFRWQTFRNGILTLGTILLAVSVVVGGFTLLIRSVAHYAPETLLRISERRQLNKARRSATEAISKKQQLNEERARMTARLQATYLFEKESGRAANAQATREFREALQSSVMRSCEIAFNHIAQVIEQYERVVAEIEDCALPKADKTQLLNALTKQLDLAATEERNKDAQQMMEAEVWKIRFQKAKLLSKRHPVSALKYLRQIMKEATGQRLKEKINTLIDSLDKSE